MPDFTFQLPAAINPATVDAGRIDAFFAGKGYQVLDGSSVRSDGTVIAHLDRDPAADVAAFANQPTPGEQGIAQAITTLKAYVASVQAIPAATRTPEQQAIFAIVAIMKAQLTP